MLRVTEEDEIHWPDSVHRNGWGHDLCEDVAGAFAAFRALRVEPGSVTIRKRPISMR